MGGAMRIGSSGTPNQVGLLGQAWIAIDRSGRYANDDEDAAYFSHGGCDFTGSTGLPGDHIAETEPTLG